MNAVRKKKKIINYSNAARYQVTWYHATWFRWHFPLLRICFKPRSLMKSALIMLEKNFFSQGKLLRFIQFRLSSFRFLSFYLSFLRERGFRDILLYLKETFNCIFYLFQTLRWYGSTVGAVARLPDARTREISHGCTQNGTGHPNVETTGNVKYGWEPKVWAVGT